MTGRWAFLLLLLAVLPDGRQLFLSAQEPWPRTVTMTGDLSADDYERVMEHEFEVPRGTRRIDVRLEYSGRERKTVIDLGLRGPSGLRGWSGGRETRISVSSLAATPGYLPGPLEPGRWSVLLGIPNIRKGSRDTYALTVTLDDRDLAPDTRVIKDEPGWYVGDLHAHSGHSDGRAPAQSGALVPVPTHRVLDAAVAARLDFVALTDHNTASHWLDVERLAPTYDGLLILRGREVTTYRGHANTAGERSFHDFRLSHPEASPADVLAPAARDEAFVSINHPRLPDDERCMGCGWNVIDDRIRAIVHGVEVVNGDVIAGPTYGWPFWSDLLNRGWRVTAVGGSDEHTPAEAFDRSIGMPATVVWARALSERGIVDGLKSGRVYVRTRGPAGPSLEFSAASGATSHTMGSVIPTSSPIDLSLRAVVTGAEGQTLDWIRNGAVVASAPVSSGPLEITLRAEVGDWFSVIIRDRRGPTVLSNAIYAGR